jgi:hypothetical protein
MIAAAQKAAIDENGGLHTPAGARHSQVRDAGALQKLNGDRQRWTGGDLC